MTSDLPFKVITQIKRTLIVITSSFLSRKLLSFINRFIHFFFPFDLIPEDYPVNWPRYLISIEYFGLCTHLKKMPTQAILDQSG